jgi:YidC/Oxa1 family membrane protein insertase
MEEKKLDVKSIIGFVIIGLLLVWMIYNQTPSEKERDEEQAKKEQIEKAKKTQIPEQKTASIAQDSTVNDSVRLAQLKGSLGAFAYSATLPSAKANITELKSKLLTLRIANKGGYIAEANLNNFEQFNKGSKKRVELIKNNNADFNLQFKTKDNRIRF